MNLWKTALRFLDSWIMSILFSFLCLCSNWFSYFNFEYLFICDDELKWMIFMRNVSNCSCYNWDKTTMTYGSILPGYQWYSILPAPSSRLSDRWLTPGFPSNAIVVSWIMLMLVDFKNMFSILFFWFCLRSWWFDIKCLTDKFWILVRLFIEIWSDIMRQLIYGNLRGFPATILNQIS